MPAGAEDETEGQEQVPEESNKLHETPFAEKWVDQVNQHLIYMHTAHKAWSYASLEAPEPINPTDDSIEPGVWADSKLAPTGPQNDVGSGMDGSDTLTKDARVTKPSALQSLTMPDVSGLVIKSPEKEEAVNDVTIGANSNRMLTLRAPHSLAGTLLS